MFNAFAKAMAFPSPQEADWESLQSYLEDLSWIPGKWYACFIENAHDLLNQSPDAFGMLIGVAGQVAYSWWESRVPFHVFLLGNHTLRDWDYSWLSNHVCFHD